MTDRVVTSEPLPMPTGRPPRGPWILAAVFAAVGVAALVAFVAIANGDDDGGVSVHRRDPPAGGVTTTSPNAGASGSGTEPETHGGSGSGTPKRTSDQGSTTSTSSTGPVISYLTAPASVVCDPGETVRAVDVTVRAERVTKLTVSGPEAGGHELSATATDPTIVGTVPMTARCATATDIVVIAIGTDGSTVERRVTVAGRVRPPAPGS